MLYLWLMEIPSNSLVNTIVTTFLRGLQKLTLESGAASHAHTVCSPNSVLQIIQIIACCMKNNNNLTQKSSPQPCLWERECFCNNLKRCLHSTVTHKLHMICFYGLVLIFFLLIGVVTTWSPCWLAGWLVSFTLGFFYGLNNVIQCNV